MRMTYYIASVAFVLMTLLSCYMAAAVETIETEDEDLLLSFDVARESWLQNVSFYGNYTFRRRVVYSEKESHTENFEDRHIVSKGIICKLRDKYCFQEFYVAEPTVRKIDGGSIVSGRSSDVIADKNFRIEFEPKQGEKFTERGSLGKMSKYTISNIVSGLITSNTPFILFLDPITEMPSNTSLEPKYTITSLEGGRESLSFTGISTNGYRYIREVVIRTNEKIPVIEQITQHSFRIDTVEPLYSWTSKGLDWRSCNGVSVPSRVRTVSGPNKLTDFESGAVTDTWIVSEWRSDDLGLRPPTDADFVLKLPPHVGLVGMNHYPKDGLVDIDAITDDDFLPSGSIYEGQETWGAMGLHPDRRVVVLWTYMILGMTLIVWVLVRMYLKRK